MSRGDKGGEGGERRLLGKDFDVCRAIYLFVKVDRNGAKLLLSVLFRRQEKKENKKGDMRRIQRQPTTSCV